MAHEFGERKKWKVVNILSYKRDQITGLQKITSEYFLDSSDDSLEKSLAFMVFDVTTTHSKRSELENEFKANPQRVDFENYKEVRRSEWPTKYEGTVLGLKSVWSQPGEIEHTWYLRKV